MQLATTDGPAANSSRIRGLPKRKGAGPAAEVSRQGRLLLCASSPAQAAPGAPAPSTSGFGFGAPPAAAASSSSTPFAFGASNGAGSSGFSFGAKPAAPPAAPAAAAAATPPPAFGGFSFGKPAAPAAEPPKAAAAPPPAFGGFSFGKPPAAAPAPVAAAPVAPPTAQFTFGKKPAETTPIAPVKEAEPAPASAAPPKPFGGFSFGGSKAAAPAAAAPAPAPVVATPSLSSLPAARVPSSGNPKSPIAPAAPAFRSSSGPGPSQATPPDEGEVSYYTSLRGLNNAFLSFVSHELNSNEFLNLTKALPGLLSQYEAHLEAAAAKAGWSPKADSEKTNGAAATPAVPAPAPAKPPAAPFSFGQPAASSTAPAAPAAAKPFSFGAPAATEAPKKASSAANQLAADILAEDDAASKAKEPEAPPAVSTPAKSGSLFSFAPSAPLAPTTPGSKTFTPSALTTSAGEPPAKLGKFGPDGTNPQLSFGGAKATPASTTATSPPAKGGFSFGSPAGASAGFSFGASGSGSTPAAGTKSPPKAAAFSFGSSAGAGGSSAFSFGSSSPAPAPAGGAKPFAFSQTLSTPAATPFSFGGASSSTPASSSPATPVPATAAEPIEVTKNLADTVGEGEEGEDTVAEQRGKLHKLEDGKYVVVGLGQFKLKSNKATGKRRLLMRADGSGSVILVSARRSSVSINLTRAQNMAVGKSFDATAEGNNVKFLGFDLAGSMKPFLLRVKTADAAATVAAAIKKEVEALKA